MSDFSKPVLAVDCALGGCIAAVMKDGRIVTRTIATDREQSAKLVPMVQEAMEEAGVTFADLSLIVTTVGPGSFTGLRIGMTTARAWGLSLNIPVQGMNTLEIMARSCVDAGAEGYTVLLETKRTDYYIQLFDAAFAPLSEPACAEVGQIDAAQGLFCGDAVSRFEKEKGIILPRKVELTLLDPSVLLTAGLERFVAGGMKPEKPEPVYLRGADVSMSNKKNREIRDYQQ